MGVERGGQLKSGGRLKSGERRGEGGSCGEDDGEEGWIVVEEKVDDGAAGYSRCQPAATRCRMDVVVNRGRGVSLMGWNRWNRNW